MRRLIRYSGATMLRAVAQVVIFITVIAVLGFILFSAVDQAIPDPDNQEERE